MWTIIGLICVVSLYAFSRFRAARAAGVATSVPPAPTPARQIPVHRGIMDATQRPPMTPDRRVRDLEPLLSLTTFARSEDLRRHDAEAMPAVSDQTIQLIEMATALYRWRGIEPPHPAARIEILEALIRDALARNGSRAVRSRIQHDLAPLQDDEIRSLHKLFLYPKFAGETTEPELRRRFMEGVADTQAFPRMMASLEENSAKTRAMKERADSWRDSIGGSDDADHLLADGWLPFLKSLDGPDIVLWHQIATEFHELAGERLDAAYWITEQPDCDRATAWAFIVGIVSWDILAFELGSADRGRVSAARDRFEDLVRRWDTGFYRYHSIATDGAEADGHHGLDLDDLRATVDRLMQTKELPDVRLPESLDVDLTAPKDDMSRSHRSGLRYSDEEGLRLVPGQD